MHRLAPPGSWRHRLGRTARRSAAAALVACAALAGGQCGASTPASSPVLPPVTFDRDIAPIVFANCTPCHRPGGIGPFPLLTYADAVKNAEAIAEQTRARLMPPWLPERGDHPIQGDRRLRDEHLDAIQRWVKGGMLEGDAKDLPAAPAYADGWELGRPDAVVTTPSPFVVQPGTDDIYRNLVLRTSLKAGVFVRAVEFKTGGAPIHHAVIRLDPTSASRRRDGEDGQPGFDGMTWGSVLDPDGHFVGWAPGRGPIVAPEGMPWRLDRGVDLVIEVHLIPPDRSFPVQPSVGLFLADSPPVRTPVTVRMGSKLIDIPAGKPDYVVTDTYELPVAVDLLGVYPHAHYLAREMLVTATLPGGGETTLIHIRQWSFHWQQDYRYVTPIPLPRGTKLTLRYVYDNSAANAENPHHPPERVQAGPKSTDEMAELGLQFLPQSAEDGRRLVEAFIERDKFANLAMAEHRVRESPRDADDQALLGGSLVEVERFAEAIPHLEAALGQKERSADTHNYLGVALMSEGRVADGLVHLERAAALAPRDEVIRFNLGNALGRLSRAAEATAAYEAALSINPEFMDAHVNLAGLLLSRGRTDEAVAHYRRAVELRPDSAVVNSNLGSGLAMAGRFQEAMRYVKRALEIDPGYGPALENFRRLQRMGIK